MTLQELSDAWNELRNAALGRGLVEPSAVSQSLAAEVADGYAQWRAYYESSGMSDDMVPSATAFAWVNLYRDLLGKMEAEGVRPAHVLPDTPVEKGQHAIEEVASDVAGVVGAGILLGVALAIAPIAFRAMRKGAR